MTGKEDNKDNVNIEKRIADLISVKNNGNGKSNKKTEIYTGQFEEYKKSNEELKSRVAELEEQLSKQVNKPKKKKKEKPSSVYIATDRESYDKLSLFNGINLKYVGDYNGFSLNSNAKDAQRYPNDFLLDARSVFESVYSVDKNIYFVYENNTSKCFKWNTDRSDSFLVNVILCKDLNEKTTYEWDKIQILRRQFSHSNVKILPIKGSYNLQKIEKQIRDEIAEKND